MGLISNLIPNKLHPVTGEDLTPRSVTVWRDGSPMTDAKCGGLYNKDTEPTSPTFGQYFKWNSTGDYYIERLTTINQSNFQKLIDDYGNDPAVIVINRPINFTGGIVTIPSNILLRWGNGVQITVSGGTLNINSAITEGNKQLFIETGAGIVNVNNQKVNLAWYGLQSRNENIDYTAFFTRMSDRSIYIPDGYFFVTDNVDLRNATGIGVVINKADLYRRLVYRQDEGRNQYSKILGSYWSNGSGNKGTNAWEQSRILDGVARLNMIPYRPFLATVRLQINASGDLIITELDSGNGYTEASWDYAMDQMKIGGGRMVAIKIHGYHSTNTGPITDVNKYFTQYKAIALRLATKYQGQGVPYFFITNESPAVTSNPAYTSYLQDMIVSVRALGYQVGMAHAGTGDADSNLVIGDLDVIGFNLYPGVSIKSYKVTMDELISAWNSELCKVDAYKAKYPDKRIFITEFSSTDYQSSLERPSEFNWPGEVLQNGKIQALFYEGALKALHRNKNIHSTFAWDMGEGFSPYWSGAPEANKLIRTLLK
jgi:hypothetical protein